MTILLAFQCKQDRAVLENEEIVKADSFSQLIEAVTLSDSADQYAFVDKFLDSLDAPFIEEDTNVYFFYVGDATSVQVAGDFNGWNPSGRNFTRLRDTDLWYRKETFEKNARLDYKLVINGSNWILDPKNPNKVGGGFGPNSELAMPEYVHPEEIEARDGIDKGTVTEIQISSTATGKTYDVHVYLPASYDESNEYPVAYFQDGSDYLNLASSKNVLDNLIADEKIVPTIGVFVVPNDRNIEYAFDDRFKYTDFFVDELVPYIDANYSTMVAAESRAVIGDSYGGNISAIIAFNNPDVFGNCGIHSGAFQPNNFHTNGIVMDGEMKAIKVATIWGTYEGSSLPPNMRKVKDYLIETGYDVIWKELPEGHSWGLWRATTDDMLEFFFSAN
ncbi:enterochelin esterase [Ekhidna lutea]|uniref:Enterochelin esterase n=1 Tax=Ekhidna lutea TaxID=447679 RepID=A0A239KT90_EKHLU|nr:enterochelin esterase [Ekhidna lutea]